VKKPVAEEKGIRFEVVKTEFGSMTFTIKNGRRVAVLFSYKEKTSEV
jgi:hypothetical protein